MSRAITIPNWGVFTFAAPDVNLSGVTNPEIRDKQLRNPVFIISKDFSRGMEIKSGIASESSIRPYNGKSFRYF